MRRPFREAFAVGIAGFDEIGPVVGQLIGEIPVAAGVRSLALGQSLEYVLMFRAVVGILSGGRHQRQIIAVRRSLALGQLVFTPGHIGCLGSAGHHDEFVEHTKSVRLVRFVVDGF